MKPINLLWIVVLCFWCNVVVAHAVAHQFETSRFVGPSAQLQSGFGAAFATDETTIAISNPGSSMLPGSVKIYSRQSEGWTLQTTLVASNGHVNDGFGASLSLDGDTLVIGAPGIWGPNVQNEGAVYVFRRIDNVWTQHFYLAPSTCATTVGCRYGASVSISNDTIAIGSPSQERGAFLNQGAVFIYRLVNDVWSLEQRLDATEDSLSQSFGEKVGIENDTVIVGAPRDDLSGVINCGSVYVYDRVGVTWNLETKLFSPNPEASEDFGRNLALSGSNLAISSSSRDTGSLINSGAVFAYTRQDAQWINTQTLIPSDPAAGDSFGLRVAISGNVLVATRPYHIDSRGSASIFNLTDGVWLEGNKLRASNAAISDRFGLGLAAGGGRVLVGAPDKTSGLEGARGVAYVFEKSVIGPDLIPEDDTGISNVDNLTNKRVLRFELKEVEPGALVQLFRDDVQVFSTIAETASLIATDASLPANGIVNYRLNHISNGVASSPTYLTVRIDTVRPIPTMSQAPGQMDPTNIQPILFSASFNEPVFGLFDQSYVSFAGSTANVSNAAVLVERVNNLYLSRVSGVQSDGTIRLSLNANALQDLAGNLSVTSVAGDNSVTLDTVRPTVVVNQAIDQADPAATMPLRFTAVFNKSVRPFTSVSLIGSTANVASAQVTITGFANTYTISINNIFSNGGTVVVSIPEASVLDLAGNPNFASTSVDNVVVVDTERPTVTINQAPGQPDPTMSLPILFQVQFSEPVSGFNPSSLNYSGSTLDVSNVTAVISGSGATYSLAISGLQATGGRIRVALSQGAGTDQAGNLSFASNSTDNTVTFINRIRDGGFESTNSLGQNSFWSSTSTRFGTSLCTLSVCGNGGGSSTPRNGNAWAWFDGSDNTNAETGTVSQLVPFPNGGDVALSFYLRIGFVSAPSTSILRVKINGVTIQSYTEPSVAEPAYTQRLIDLSAFADGNSHMLMFEYQRPGGATPDNFSIDDVSLIVEKVVQPPLSAPFDLDGDGKTDVSIFRPNGGSGSAEWWWVNSGSGSSSVLQFGAATDIIAPGDFTGDGKMDITIFRPSTGTWFVLRSEDLSFFSFPFGAAGDVPATGDYDGDGKADPAVFRASVGQWFIQRSSDNQVQIVQFGIPGDVAVTADYDGDGKDDIGIYRRNGANGGEWWINRSTAGVIALTFGTATDLAVPGDYTGDGKTDIAFFRPSNGTWFVLRSEDLSFFSFPFGATGDVPSPGDYDGDGRIDPAVFRPSSATWFIQGSTSGTQIQQFGSTGDVPVPSSYVR